MVFTFLFAILLIAFGIFGYVKASSLPSLLSGVGFGALLLLSALGMKYKKTWARGLSYTILSILVVVFSTRAIMTHKLLPSCFAILSIALIIHLRKNS